MTDPVDTDALRAALGIARPAIELAIGWAEHEGAGLDSDEQDAVDAVLIQCAAAADEVDRLRAELDAWEPAWRNMRDERDKARAAYEDAEAARSAAVSYGDRLRAVIENAPHEELCMTNIPAEKGPYCDCWKAGAL